MRVPASRQRRTPGRSTSRSFACRPLFRRPPRRAPLGQRQHDPRRGELPWRDDRSGRRLGATGHLTVRADSGFYAQVVVAVCRRLRVHFSITVRQHAGVRRFVEAIPAAAWTPIPYWLACGADVAETTYTLFAAQPGAVPVRLIVRDDSIDYDHLGTPGPTIGAAGVSLEDQPMTFR